LYALTEYADSVHLKIISILVIFSLPTAV